MGIYFKAQVLKRYRKASRVWPWRPPPKIPSTTYTLTGEGAGKGLRVLQIPPHDKSYSVLQYTDLFKVYDDIENTVTTFSYFTENQELFLRVNQRTNKF